MCQGLALRILRGGWGTAEKSDRGQVGVGWGIAGRLAGWSVVAL